MSVVKKRLSAVRRGIRDRDFTEEEILARQATSNTDELPSANLLEKIGLSMLKIPTYTNIFEILWRRLTHLEYRRHVRKALHVVDHLLRTNPPSPAVQLALVVDIRDRWADISRLAQLRLISSASILLEIRQMANQICDFVVEYEKRSDFEENRALLRTKRNQYVGNSDKISLQEHKDGEESLWPCAQCSFENSDKLQACVMCEAVRLYSARARSASNSSAASASNPAKKQGKWWWACAHCSFVNEKPGFLDHCEMCENKRTGKVHGNAPVVASQEPPPPPAAAEWQCINCTFANSDHVSHCQVCQMPRSLPVPLVRQEQRKWECLCCKYANQAHRNVCAVCNKTAAQTSEELEQEKAVEREMDSREMQLLREYEDAGALVERLKRELAAAEARVRQLGMARAALEEEKRNHREASERARSQLLAKARAQLRLDEEEEKRVLQAAREAQERERERREAEEILRLQRQAEQLEREKERVARQQAEAAAKAQANLRQRREREEREKREQLERQQLPKWSCSWCSYLNAATESSCDVCDRPRASGVDSTNQSYAQPPPPLETGAGWACAWCRTMNTGDTCQACGRDRRASGNAHGVKLQYGREADTGIWQCPRCSLVNAANTPACGACGIARAVAVMHTGTPPPDYQRSKSHPSFAPHELSNTANSVLDVTDNHNSTNSSDMASSVHTSEAPTSAFGDMSLACSTNYSARPTFSPAAAAPNAADSASSSSGSHLWNCANCGFVNSVQSPQCDVCDSPAPPVTSTAHASTAAPNGSSSANGGVDGGSDTKHPFSAPLILPATDKLVDPLEDFLREYQ